jgi:Fe2+ or Zn2+ uptake regulation protein
MIHVHVFSICASLATYTHTNEPSHVYLILFSKEKEEEEEEEKREERKKEIEKRKGFLVQVVARCEDVPPREIR